MCQGPEVDEHTVHSSVDNAATAAAAERAESAGDEAGECGGVNFVEGPIFKNLQKQTQGK